MARDRLVRTESMNPTSPVRKKMLPTRDFGPRDLDTKDARNTPCLDVPTVGVDYYLDVGRDANDDND